MSSFLCSCFWSPRPKIPEEYLRPQGLYSLERVDLKKLKRLIRNQQLAPCHPGAEEPGTGQDLEECPICFLYYPILNSSLCCHKRVCTECFLQVQTSTPPHQLSSCPFCKVTRPTGYLVKLIGARTAEEKEQERVEEQKVIEARIREREEEMRRDQERALQRQQQQPTTAATTATTAGSNSTAAQQQHQQSSSAVMAAAAAAAASSLEPSGAVAASATGVRSAGRGAAAAAGVVPTAASEPASVGTHGHSGGGGHASHYTQRHANSDRHRSAGVAASTEGGTAASTGRIGGGGVYPTASGRRAAAQLQLQQQQLHGQHHPGDRHPAGAEGAGRRYRLTDYVPAGVADIAMGLDDINDLMLEQAMYESLAVAGAGNPPQAQPAATRGGGRGGVTRVDEGAVANEPLPDDDPLLAAALAASLDGDGGAIAGSSGDRPAQSASRGAAGATAGAGSPAADGPAGRVGWRQASARSGQLAPSAPEHQTASRGPLAQAPTQSAVRAARGSPGGGVVTATSPRPVVEARRSQQQLQQHLQQQQPPTPSPPTRGARPAVTPTRPAAPVAARGMTATGGAVSGRGSAADYVATSDNMEEEDDREISLVSRRGAAAVPASPAAVGPAASAPAAAAATAAAAAAATAVVGGSQADTSEGTCPAVTHLEAVTVATVGGDAPATSPPVAAPAPHPGAPQSQCEEFPAAAPGAESTAPFRLQHSATDLLPVCSRPGAPSSAPTTTVAAAAIAEAVVDPRAAGLSPSSLGMSTPATLSPVPSDSPVGAYAARTSDLSSCATGGAADRVDLLDGVSGGGAAAAGDQHVTNPLYDIWSNSSSATTCKHQSVDAPGLAVAAAGAQEDGMAGPAARLAAGRSASSINVAGRWGITKCSNSEQSTRSIASEGGVGPQQSAPPPESQNQKQQTQPAPSAAGVRVASGDNSGVSAGERTAKPLRPAPLRRPPPPPPTAAATVTAAVSAAKSNASAGAVGTAMAAGSLPALTSGTSEVNNGLLAPSPPVSDTLAAAAATALPTTDAAAAGSAAPATIAAAGSAALPGTTVVTIQSLAAELLRHGSGTAAAAAAAGSAESSGSLARVVAVGMVFLAPNGGASAQGSSLPPPAPAAGSAGAAAGGSGSGGSKSSTVAASLKEPTWVENPDGSLQVLMPKDGVAAKAPRQRRPIDGYAGNSDDVMDVPYTDYELPALQPLPSLGSTGLDLPPSEPYIADGGNEPAPMTIEAMDPEEEAEAEAVDEALVQHCERTDKALVQQVATSDAAVAAAIAAGDRRTTKQA